MTAPDCGSSGSSGLCQESLRNELLQVRVREKLRAEEVRLWLEPYCLPGGLQELTSRYGRELGIGEEKVKEMLEALQQHTLTRLAHNERFRNDGIATLRCRIAEKTGESKTESFETRLDVSGLELKTRISEISGIPMENLRVIAAGHIIVDSEKACQQGVKQNCQLLAIRMQIPGGAERNQEYKQQQLARTRRGAELLANLDEADAEDGPFLQIADHRGNPIKIPAQEKKALMTAMTLHEKGRSLLKHGDHSGALVLLLEADQDFRTCGSELISVVDNYAVLCLDVVWCYVALRCLDALPDARERLTLATQALDKCYGVNLERLFSLKGSSGREQALYLRLHLLQGIIAFHQGTISEAREQLNKAGTLMNLLTVDEEKLSELVALGFSEQESRLGLRACGGNMEQAGAHIMHRREEKQAQQQREHAERRQARRVRKYGRTAGGHWVDRVQHTRLTVMGFTPRSAAEALRQSDNNLDRALQVLQEQPELLELRDESTSAAITEEQIMQVVSMGFGHNIAAEALNRCSGIVEQAIDVLVAHGGFLPLHHNLSSSSSSSTDPSPTEESTRLEEREAMEEAVADIPEHEEDYLDLTLHEEQQLLCTYHHLLQESP
uniref:Negative regulator of ubiquitin-like proteins 1 n=1 Tax=Eptatretus burgeri TaxID=7764 RepID=A0A8C4QTL3_EPTBU